jgi:hypothetical protein
MEEQARSLCQGARPVLSLAPKAKGHQEVKRLTAANGGDKMAYAHILDLATGRKGKLKRELLEVRRRLTLPCAC